MRAAIGAIALGLIAVALWLVPAGERTDHDATNAPPAIATATITWLAGEDRSAEPDPFEFIELIFESDGRAIGAWQAHVHLTGVPGATDRTAGPSLVGLEAGDLPGMVGPPRHDAGQVAAGSLLIGHRLPADADPAAIPAPLAGTAMVAARLHVAVGPGRLVVRDLLIFDPAGAPMRVDLRLVRHSPAGDAPAALARP